MRRPKKSKYKSVVIKKKRYFDYFHLPKAFLNLDALLKVDLFLLQAEFAQVFLKILISCLKLPLLVIQRGQILFEDPI